MADEHQEKLNEHYRKTLAEMLPFMPSERLREILILNVMLPFVSFECIRQMLIIALKPPGAPVELGESLLNKFNIDDTLKPVIDDMLKPKPPRKRRRPITDG